MDQTLPQAMEPGRVPMVPPSREPEQLGHDPDFDDEKDVFSEHMDD